MIFFIYFLSYFLTKKNLFTVEILYLSLFFLFKENVTPDLNTTENKNKLIPEKFNCGMRLI